MSKISSQIRQYLLQQIPSTWDGKDCILELKEANYNWKQMEWIGWYFEWKAKTLLKKEFGGGDGPVFGAVEFDYELAGVWDFKTHPKQSNKWTYLNDYYAVNECLMKKGHLAWLIAVGDAQYDTDGEFKKWHDALKTGISSYEINRITRGAPSRTRKVSFQLEDILVVEFTSMDDINRALSEGWLRDDMQEGQRNSSGSPRKRKYGINVEEIPNQLVS